MNLISNVNMQYHYIYHFYFDVLASKNIPCSTRICAFLAFISWWTESTLLRSDMAAGDIGGSISNKRTREDLELA